MPTQDLLDIGAEREPEGRNGITVLAHVLKSLSEATADLATVTAAIDGRRLKPAERDRLQRMLAGVIGDCETVRIWLNAGGPR